MNDKKQKELGQLYALRAGMSLISQNYDKIQEDKKEVVKLENETKNYTYTGKKKSDVDGEVDEMLEKNKNVNNALRERAFVMYSYLEEKSRLFLRLFEKGYSIIGETITDFFGDMASSDKFYVFLLYLILVGLIYLIGTIFLVVLEIITFPFALISPVRIKKSRIKKAFKKDKFFNTIFSFNKDQFMGVDLLIESEDINDYITIMLDATKYQYAKYDNKYLKYDRQKHRILMPSAIQHIYDNVVSTYEDQRKAGYIEVEKQVAVFEEKQTERKLQFERSTEEHTIFAYQRLKESKELINALKALYSSLLDIRDWGNVDLIIYYYETGRADTIKEALQLVDLESKNNIICKASLEVRDSIKSGNYQFDENISTELSFTKQELEKALFEKADITSKSIAKHIIEINSPEAVNKNIFSKNLK